MRLLVAYDESAWAKPAVRWGAALAVSLIDTPYREAPPGASASADEMLVFVGDPALAPADAAVVVACTAWTPWTPETLGLANFEGEPLPCPFGMLSPLHAENALPPEWLRAIVHVAAREEERSDPRRDQWECYGGEFTALARLGVLHRAIVNRLVRRLAHRLERACARRGARLERVPRWPDGRTWAAVLTHDVDDVQLFSLPAAWRLLRQARSPRSYAFRGGLTSIGRSLANLGRPDPYWSFDRWTAAEAERGFRSTFFFHPFRPTRRHEYDPLYAEHDPVPFAHRRGNVADLMRGLRERGWEVGLHGSYLSHRDAAELARQREQIANASGALVRGTRQHFLRFAIDETWEAQEKAGFEYDATCGYNEAVGFRAGLAVPWHPWDPRRGHARHLLELPLTVMDGALFRSQRLPLERAVATVREHLDEVREVGGLSVLLWHPNAADERRFPGWWPAYGAALESLSAGGAWVATGEQVATWWRERAVRLTGNATAIR
jgi:peptidoglycan/xylan/chitin deacetylase (PgdA/CDA1 family)